MPQDQSEYDQIALEEWNRAAEGFKQTIQQARLYLRRQWTKTLIEADLCLARL